MNQQYDDQISQTGQPSAAAMITLGLPHSAS
jgi:hypothetical protein